MNERGGGFILLAPAGALVALMIRYGVTWTGFAGLQRGAVAVVVVVVLAGLWALLRPGSTVGGRKMTVRTGPGHGTRLAANHEGGHVAVTKAVGGTVHTAHIYPDGSGVTYLTLPRNISVVDRIAVDVAGEVAAGTRSGCGTDQAYMREALRTLPAGERAAARRAGYARARAVTGGWSDGGVGKVAKVLLTKGTYR